MSYVNAYDAYQKMIARLESGDYSPLAPGVSPEHALDHFRQCLARIEAEWLREAAENTLH